MVDDQINDKPSAAISKLQQRYVDVVTLRACVQAIPYIGGSLDTLLAGRATQIQLQRVEKFASDLAHRLASVESTAANLNDEALAVCRNNHQSSRQAGTVGRARKRRPLVIRS